MLPTHLDLRVPHIESLSIFESINLRSTQIFLYFLSGRTVIEALVAIVGSSAPIIQRDLGRLESMAAKGRVIAGHQIKNKLDVFG